MGDEFSEAQSTFRILDLESNPSIRQYTNPAQAGGLPDEGFIGCAQRNEQAYFFLPGSASHVSSGLTWPFVTQLMPGKQQGRRFPFASMSQAASIRRSRVSVCLGEVTQRIHSRRAMGVISLHRAWAFPAALRAAPRSD